MLSFRITWSAVLLGAKSNVMISIPQRNAAKKQQLDAATNKKWRSGGVLVLAGVVGAEKRQS
jgi:hypothetical protein